ncbi:pheromone receptor transcription factor-like [Cryptomeria japonica]|uniref:pheromone receptor transcription factor-like n=1 Tax=Cryptomeria japonica TaxID=3369 RepID=UPI0027DA529D|nr:pheromone receptor transcription factor-like [Cryptomeria japonica]
MIRENATLQARLEALKRGCRRGPQRENEEEDAEANDGADENPNEGNREGELDLEERRMVRLFKVVQGGGIDQFEHRFYELKQYAGIGNDETMLSQSAAPFRAPQAPAKGGQQQQQQQPQQQPQQQKLKQSQGQQGGNPPHRRNRN